MPTITFRRASNVQNIPITDGQIIFDTSRNIILMDNGNVRNQYAGATQLVSTTPEATSTNAFNAQATTQLFLQKTTVIDTKANALAVNQNYIPLGCLAFKEALGTSNYSNIGNGTISGALVALNNKDTKINNQLSANNNEFYFDYQNGKYGYNTDPNRGADTFNPFKSVPSGTTVCISAINGRNSGQVTKIIQSGTYNIFCMCKRFGGYDPYVSVVVNGATRWSWHNTNGDENGVMMEGSGTIQLNEDDLVYVTAPQQSNIGMTYTAIMVWKQLT